MPVLRSMDKWNIENNHNPYYEKKDMYYKNEDAVENVIRYISRTRWNEKRRGELVWTGGAGINVQAPVTEIIQEFLRVQNFYEIDKRGGRRLIHLVYSFTDEEMKMLNCSYALVDLIARYISAYFFEKGFQVFYGIHYSMEKKVHIHFAVSAISYLDGKKYHAGGESFKEMMDTFLGFFQRACVLGEQQRCCINTKVTEA